MLDGMSDSIQRSRIENLHSREVDRQSPTGLIFVINTDPLDLEAVVHIVFYAVCLPTLASNARMECSRTFEYFP